MSYTLELSYLVRGDAPRDHFLSSDAISHQVTVRFGGDRHYWPHASAGVGPALTIADTRVGDIHALTFTIGLALYGAD